MGKWIKRIWDKYDRPATAGETYAMFAIAIYIIIMVPLLVSVIW